MASGSPAQHWVCMFSIHLQLYGMVSYHQHFYLKPCVTACACQLIRGIMDQAVANGLNVMRAWAAAVSPEYALQPSPGNFSEPIFRWS